MSGGFIAGLWPLFGTDFRSPWARGLPPPRPPGLGGRRPPNSLLRWLGGGSPPTRGTWEREPPAQGESLFLSIFISVAKGQIRFFFIHKSVRPRRGTRLVAHRVSLCSRQLPYELKSALGVAQRVGGGVRAGCLVRRVGGSTWRCLGPPCLPLWAESR